MDTITDLQCRMAHAEREDEDAIARRENRAICERLDRIGWTLKDGGTHVN